MILRMPRFTCIILIMAVLCITGCNPRELPGLKQGAKRQEERITRETERAIKESPALQELNRLCVEEVPRPNGFVLVNKYRDLHGEKFLGYGYHSDADYQFVKSFYLEYFSRHGWQLTNVKDSGWGQPQIEFRKDNHLVRIYDLGQGEGINYSLHCEKLTGAF